VTLRIPGKLNRKSLIAGTLSPGSRRIIVTVASATGDDSSHDAYLKPPKEHGMDSRMFDGVVRDLDTTRTRRKALAALAAGGLSWGFLRAEDADARKKKHKRKKKRKNKRCLQLGSTCNPGGKRRCCTDLSCKVRTGNTQADCCLERGSVCVTAEDCCEGVCITNLIGGTVKHCTVVS